MTLAIVRLNPDKTCTIMQPLKDYKKNPHWTILAEYYGKSFLELLDDEEKITTDYKKELILKTEVITNSKETSRDIGTKLIGRIAESLVVKRCNEDRDLNRYLAMYSRFGKHKVKSLDKYSAVALGSMVTKRKYNRYYNPGSTQHDVIWVDNYNPIQQLLCMSSTPRSGQAAGIQVKVSSNMNYVIKNSENYKCPILYFDLEDDWAQANYVISKNNEELKLIPPNKALSKIKDELRQYLHLAIAIYSGDCSLKELFQHAQHQKDTLLKFSIEAATIPGNFCFTTPCIEGNQFRNL